MITLFKLYSKLVNKKDKVDASDETCQEEMVKKRLKNLLLLEKLEVEGVRLLAELKHLENKNYQEVASLLNELTGRNDFLIDKADALAKDIKNLELKFLKK